MLPVNKLHNGWIYRPNNPNSRAHSFSQAIYSVSNRDICPDSIAPISEYEPMLTTRKNNHEFYGEAYSITDIDQALEDNKSKSFRSKKRQLFAILSTLVGVSVIVGIGLPVCRRYDSCNDIIDPNHTRFSGFDSSLGNTLAKPSILEQRTSLFEKAFIQFGDGSKDTPSFERLQSETTEMSESFLIEQWHLWADAAPKGTKEFRDIAVTLVVDCIKNKEDALILRRLRLTDLPPYLPNHIRTLDVSHNKLRQLPTDLPPDLFELNASLNQLTSLPACLPESLEHLYLSKNNLTEIPEKLPRNLKDLVVMLNRLVRLPEDLPSTLEILSLEGNLLYMLPMQLPPGLRILDIGHNNFTTLPDELPTTLRGLFLTGNHLSALPNNISQMKRLSDLYIDYNEFVYLPPDLPDSIIIIHAGHNRIIVLPKHLPHDLKELRLEHNNLSEISHNLPPYLEELDVSYNQLRQRPQNLPESVLDNINFDHNPFIEETSGTEKMTTVSNRPRLRRPESVLSPKRNV